jgi:hypothetical protein
VQDDGGTANGGVDIDGTLRTLSIRVTPANQPPSFTKGADQSVQDLSGAQGVELWAKNISAGPPYEAGQKVHFDVTSDNAALFAFQPAVDGNGKLTFEPKVGASGKAVVSVVAVDDGGTANGGIDRSQQQTFTIEVALMLPFHNRSLASDVSGDGDVVAEDVVDVINYINAKGSGPLVKDGQPVKKFYDVTGDDYIAADDVITIINYINAHPIVQKEAPADVQPTTVASDDALLLLLALDTATQPKRRLS